MFSNPFNEERQERLKNDTAEFLTTFTKEFIKMYGVAILEKIESEVNGETGNLRKLIYRDWNSIAKPKESLYAGYVFMKTGDGPGTWGKWQKVFVAEQSDYKIGIFDSDKDHASGKKPKSVISVCGYKLTRWPSHHYSWRMRSLAAGLGLSSEEVEIMTKFSTHSWALTHPWRTNYIFQLHKSKEPMCGCFGGSVVPEDDNVGADEAKLRDEYITFMDRCVTNCKVRDESSTTGVALSKTFAKLPRSMSRLWWWTDNGTESEMITDAILEQVWSPIRDDMLSDLAGMPVSIRLSTLYKITGVVQTTINTMVAPAWKQIQSTTETVGSKVEPIIRQGTEPIFKLKIEAKEKIRGAIVKPVGDVLSKFVTPFLKPILDAFNKPIKEAFQNGRYLFETKVIIASLPDDETARNTVLDALPRSWDVVHDAIHASYDVIEPLKQLKSISEEIFDEMDAYAYRAIAEEYILTTLDAALNTLEIKINELGKSGAEKNKEFILRDYDHDTAVNLSTMSTIIIKDLLLGHVKKGLAPVVEPIFEQFNSIIPEDMQDFVSIDNLYEEVLDLLVGEPIEKVVKNAYPVH